MTGKPAVGPPAPAPLIVDLVGRARSFLLLTHHNPDGDALGSASALARVLAGAGRRAELALAGAWPGHLSFLLESLTVREAALANPAACDLTLLLDCHTLDRAGVGTPPAVAPLVVIDHHPLAGGGRGGETWFHHPEASSTGELTWRLIQSLGLTPPPEAVEALLVAIASDTGFFSQGNATAGALGAAAELVALGGRLDTVHRRLKHDLPLRRFKLMGLALDSMSLRCGGRLAVMTVTPDMLARTGAVMADTEDLAEMGLRLAGVNLSALIKDSGQGLGGVRVSLRGRETVDASALAGTFGGGGHRQAAAYNDPGASTAEEAAANLTARAAEIL